MVFEVKDKVAIVTGGASGIGLSIIKQLLKHGAKGVVIADNNAKNGEKSSTELKNEFGADRAVFVETDVADSTSFENAFKVTLQHFKNIDILINNAGICRDDIWEKEIDINLKGTTNGIILGLENYLRHHKQGEEAVILNISSLRFVIPSPVLPVYTATKYGIVALTQCFGQPCHFERTKIRVVAICPGLTDTSILKNLGQHRISSEYTKMSETINAEFRPPMQSSDAVAKEAINILEKAPNGSVWLSEDSQPAYEYKMPDRSTCKNNILQ